MHLLKFEKMISSINIRSLKLHEFESFILYTEMLKKLLFPFKKTLQEIKIFMFRIFKFFILVLFSSVHHLRLASPPRDFLKWFSQVISTYFLHAPLCVHAGISAYQSLWLFHWLRWDRIEIFKKSKKGESRFSCKSGGFL